jgi:hypothetical protein
LYCPEQRIRWSRTEMRISWLLSLSGNQLSN